MKNIEGNIAIIKQHLKKHGGLFITNRAVGKTTALLELLHEDEDAYLITFNGMQVRTLQDIYKKKFQDSKEKRIISNANIYEVRKGYIDEYFYHETLYKDFKGAISTMRFPVIVKKLDSAIDESRAQLGLSEQQYAVEISLDFGSASPQST